MLTIVINEMPEALLTDVYINVDRITGELAITTYFDTTFGRIEPSKIGQVFFNRSDSMGEI